MRWAVTFRYHRGIEGGALRAIAGPHSVTLYTDVPHQGEDFKTVADTS
jgi:hypothetical protein